MVSSYHSVILKERNNYNFKVSFGTNCRPFLKVFLDLVDNSLVSKTRHKANASSVTAWPAPGAVAEEEGDGDGERGGGEQQQHRHHRNHCTPVS